MGPVEALTLAAADEPCDMEVVYQACWARLVRTAWMMCGSLQEAEDIVQDAFVRLATNGQPIPENPLAYLRQVVVNLVRDRHRRSLVALRNREAPADSVLDQPIWEPPILESGDAFTWEVVSGLPPRQRQALVLRYHDDLSLREIGAALGCPVPAVKSLIHRGLARLRKEMQANG